MDRILTVVTPAVSKNLTTLANVKAELGIVTDAKDAFLNRYIAVASQAAMRYCGGELLLETVTERFRPFPYIDSASLTNMPEYVHLKRFPVVTIASVWEDAQQILPHTYYPDESMGVWEYEVDPPRGRLIRLQNGIAVRWCFRLLTVNYSGGYVLGSSEGNDLEQGVIEIIKDMWAAQTRDPSVKMEEVSGISRTEYWTGAGKGDDSAWPLKVVDLLGPYKRPIF